MEEIEITKPDDWHVHFRDNEILKAAANPRFMQGYAIGR